MKINFLIKCLSITLFVSVLSNLVRAQDVYNIITDRPDLTESAVSVPFRFLQIETGFQYRNSSFEENSVKIENNEFTIASTLFRYGLTDNMELRFGGEYFTGKSKIGGIENTQNGIQGISLGSKFMLIDGSGFLNNVALLIELGLPVGNKNLNPDKIEPALIIAASKDFSDNVGLTTNVGIENSTSVNTFFYSASLDVSLLVNLGMYFEYFGDSSNKQIPNNNFDFGFYFLQQKNIQLDLYGGTKIFSDQTNWFGGFGISLRFPE